MVPMGAFHIDHFLLLSLLSDAKLSLEENMKRSAILMYSGIFFVSLACLMTVSGCMAGAGETKAEVARRHSHIMKSNMRLMQDDIDAVLMLDNVSKASDKFVRP
jgi:hypothetical protein